MSFDAVQSLYSSAAFSLTYDSLNQTKSEEITIVLASKMMAKVLAEIEKVELDYPNLHRNPDILIDSIEHQLKISIPDLPSRYYSDVRNKIY
ncbi:MAG: hypothetical protein AAF600_21045 [Bacteroidota bacterium]